MKAAFAGFLAGVALVMTVAFAIARHRSAPPAPPPDSPDTPAAIAGPPPDPAAGDLPALRARAASLRDESARLATSLRELPEGAAPGKPPRRSRRDLGTDLLALFGGRGSGEHDLYSRVRMELAVLAGEATDKEGVTPAEGLLSPQMLEALLMGMREACTEEISGPESKALQAALDDYRRKWDSWKAGGKDVDGFEHAAALMGIQREAREALFAAADAETTAALRSTMDGLDQYNDYCHSEGVYSEGGDHAKALVARWVDDLELDAAAVAALRPVAEEYLRSDPRAADVSAGARDLVENQKRLLKMAKVRKRIGEVASLTEEQARNLAAWQKVYSISGQHGSSTVPSGGDK